MSAPVSTTHLPPVMSVGEGLDWGRGRLADGGVPTADLDAQLLLAHTLGVERPGLFARHRRVMSGEELGLYHRLVRKRADRVPLAYLLGTREFWSLSFAVDGRVLIPRPETEGVIEAARPLITPGCRVLDVGTGSGNIVAALAGEIEGVEWHAVDISPDALAVAAENLRAHGLADRVALARSDLFEAFDRGHLLFDVVLANLPYIPSGDLAMLEPEVRDYEPKAALDGGEDGLSAVRRLIGEAPPFLRRGAALVMEVGAGQSSAARSILMESGEYRDVEITCDLAGLERVVVARRS